jgi:Secretion system C-terminal sorting domain
MNGKRAVVFGLLIVLIACSVQAELIWPQENGTEIYQSRHSGITTTIASNELGNTFVVWGDHTSGSRDLYGQLLDASNQPLWPFNGRPLVQQPGMQEAVAAIPTDGGWILLWMDARSTVTRDHATPSIHDLYVQKFSNTGTPQWDEGGVLAVDYDFNTDEKDEIAFVPDGSGGAYLIWLWDVGEQRQTVAKHLLASGVIDPAWPEEGILLEDITYTNLVYLGDLTAVPGEQGGFVAVWKARLSETVNQARGQKVDSSGQLMWNDEGSLLICESTTHSIYSTTICSDGLGGAFVTWYQHDDTHAIFVQRVLADGALPWGDVTGQSLPESNDADNNPQIVQSSDQSAIILWSRFNPDGRTMMQRIRGDESLERLWGDEGIIISDEYVSVMKVVADGDGGIIAATGKYNDQHTLYHYNVNAELLTPVGGIDLNDEISSLNGIQLSNPIQQKIQISYGLSDGHFAIYSQAYQLDTHDLLLPGPGIALSSGGRGQAVYHQMTTVDNTPLYAWIDGRHLPYAELPFIQSLDPQTGEKRFGEWGYPLLPGYPFFDGDTLYFSATETEIAVMATSDQSLVCLTGIRDLDENQRFFILQKADVDGQVLWGDQGIQFSLEEYSSWIENAHLLAIDDGGVILVFNYFNVDWYMGVGAQRFDASGTPQWTEGENNFLNITEVGLERDDEVVGVSRLDNGQISIVTKGDRPDKHYAYLISDDGVSLWDDALQVTDVDFDYGASLNLNGDLLTVFVVEEDQPGEAIAAQLISESGELLWGEQPLILMNNESSHYDSKISLAMADESSFWLVFHVGIGDVDQIKAQRFTNEGNPVFTDDGITMVEGNIAHENCRVAIEVLSDHSVYISWKRYLGNEDYGLEYRRVSLDGTFPDEYSEGPHTLSTIPEYQYGLTLQSDGEGGAYAFWADRRGSVSDFSTTSLFGQRLNDGFAGVAEPSATIPDSWAVHAAYPNPFNATTRVTIDLPASAEMQVKLFDILGREVMTIANERLTPGQHNLTVDASSLASGMYFLSIEQIGGSKKLQKLVVLK